jgi:hypothetical protein
LTDKKLLELLKLEEHIKHIQKNSRKARSDFDRAYLGKGTSSDIED